MQDTANKTEFSADAPKPSRAAPWSHTLSSKVFGDPATIELERRLFAGVMRVKKAIAVTMVLATVAALSLVEHRFPSIILPYANAEERFADVVLTLLLCLLLLLLAIREFLEGQIVRVHMHGNRCVAALE